MKPSPSGFIFTAAVGHAAPMMIAAPDRDDDLIVELRVKRLGLAESAPAFNLPK